MLVTTGFNSTQSPVFTLGNWACLPLFHFWPGWTSPSFYSPLEHMPLGSINSCSALKNQDNVAAQMRIIAMPPGHDGNLWHQYLLFSCFKSYLYINGNATYSTTINVCRGPLLPNLHPCVWPGLECARCPPAFYPGHTDYERVHTNIYIFFKTDPCFLVDIVFLLLSGKYLSGTPIATKFRPHSTDTGLKAQSYELRNPLGKA